VIFRTETKCRSFTRQTLNKTSVCDLEKRSKQQSLLPQGGSPDKYKAYSIYAWVILLKYTPYPVLSSDQLFTLSKIKTSPVLEGRKVLVLMSTEQL
jgi:hypothetical protein